MPVYSVPSAVVFKRWGARSEPQTRRLLLRNDGLDAISIRLTLPSHPIFKLTGANLEEATRGKGAVVLGPKATMAFLVTLNPERADSPEIHTKLLVRMRREWLHVPITALRDDEQPLPPDAYSTAPAEREHWDDDSDDEEGSLRMSLPNDASSRGQLRRSKQLPELTIQGDLRVTPAPCTEADELSFYKQLIQQDMSSDTVRKVAAPDAGVQETVVEAECKAVPLVELVRVRSSGEQASGLEGKEFDGMDAGQPIQGEWDVFGTSNADGRRSSNDAGTAARSKEEEDELEFYKVTTLHAYAARLETERP